MISMVEESLFATLVQVAMEELGITEEQATSFAHTAMLKVTSFFLRFDNIPDYLVLRDIKFENDRFIVEWESISTYADCPICGKTSYKAYSAHLRSEMVQDNAVNGKSLWHKIWRKKYVCQNDHCVHKQFLEGVHDFVDGRYSRMTISFAERVMILASETSNNAAAKVLQSEGAKISHDTINHLLLKRGGQQLEKNLYDHADSVTHVGIDDINWRKGNHSTSCLVVVDLDRRQVLCIAQGTTGETAEGILSMFPNLEAASRDRATAMSSALDKLGIMAVADRFHITSNMHDTIERTLHDYLPSSVFIPTGNSWTRIALDKENDEVIAVSIPAKLSENDIRQRVRLAHLSAIQERNYRDTLKILELTTAGKHAKEISVVMNLPVERVRSLRAGMREQITSVEKKIDEFCENPRSVKLQRSVSVRAEDSSKSIVEPYRDEVISMLKEGRSHWSIQKALHELGFKGSHSTVDNYIIKLKREGSIEAELKASFWKTKDLSALIPERPERIAVCIFSVKTIYARVLVKVKERKSKGNDRNQASENDNSDEDASDSERIEKAKSNTHNKRSLAPKSNRTNIPLELIDKLNWSRKADDNSTKSATKIPNQDERIDNYLSTMFPVFNDMIQFGVDYHNFMDNNDLEGLTKFIDKYISSTYPRVSQFAHGLQMDMEAVKNTMLHPEISNGIVEGLNSSIKCQKRVGGSKMKIDFLASKMMLRTAEKSSA